MQSVALESPSKNAPTRCDPSVAGTTYVPIAEASTRAWFRRGSGAWTPLPLALVREDAGDGSAGGRAAAGFLYEADLTLLGDSPGVVSFRTEIVDRTGNRSTWTLEPAIPARAERRPAASGPPLKPGSASGWRCGHG